jgi:hypothetical protein
VFLAGDAMGLDEFADGRVTGGLGHAFAPGTA